MSTRALEACRSYVHWRDEIARLTKQIGDTAAMCPQMFVPGQQSSEVHLFVYYRARNALYNSGLHGMGPLLGEAEVLRCPHCLHLDVLIQQRKAARQKFGAAKRWIARLGKEAE